MMPPYGVIGWERVTLFTEEGTASTVMWNQLSLHKHDSNPGHTVFVPRRGGGGELA